MKNLFLVGLIFITLSTSYAQVDRSCVKVKADGQSYVLDSLSVIPTSFSFSEKVSFSFNPTDNSISIENKNGQEIEVCFNTFSFSFSNSYSHRSLTGDVSVNEFGTKKTLAEASNRKIINEGFISRGLQAGNNQSLATESYMDFRLRGNLTEKIKINAHLYDRNIAYQPEGTTHQLKNFNRLFINLEGEKYGISLGDLAVKKNGHLFSPFNRTVTGLEAAYRDSTLSLLYGVGENRGNYYQCTIRGEENVSGPYVLHGPPGVPFMVILSGTEKVYLDGKLLKRGEEYDYIIDYNLSEISFMPGLTITDFSRIRVDFEYRDEGLSKTSSWIEASYKKNKQEFGFSYIKEADRFREMESFLEADQLLALKELSGESTYKYLDAQETGWNTENILYHLIDTLIDDSVTKVLKRASDSTLISYKVNFYWTQEGMGSYDKAYDEKGRVYYQWVGDNSGSYTPYREIYTPVAREIISTSFSSSIGKNDSIVFNGSLSNKDNNLFNRESNSHNRGAAIDLAYILGERSLFHNRELIFSGDLLYRRIGENFDFLEPVFEVEFDRSWSLQTMDMSGDDQLMGGILRLREEVKGWDWMGSMKSRQIGESFNGFEYLSGFNRTKGWWQTRTKFRIMEANRSDGRKDKNLNLSSEFFSSLGPIQPGFKILSDRHTSMTSQGDIINSLQYFDEFTGFIRSIHDSIASWNVSYKIRNNYLPNEGEMKSYDRSESLTLSWNIPGSLLRWSGDLVFRKLVRDSLQIPTMAGKSHLESVLWKGSVRQKLSIFSTTGWENMRAFTYVEVPVGQGYYAWRDQNNDGIRQLNEFYEAIFDDERRFIRMYTPGIERLGVADSRFSYHINWVAPKVWHNRQGFRSFVAPLLVSVRVERSTKITGLSFVDRWHSMGASLMDENIIQGSNNSSLSVSYPIHNSSVILAYRILNSERKNYINEGYEWVANESQHWEATGSFTDWWSTKGRVSKNFTSSASDLLQDRNYKINQIQYMVENEFLISKSWKLLADWERSFGRGEDNEDKRSANFNSISLGIRGSILKSLLVENTLTWNESEIQDQQMDAMSYQLLNANMPGTNVFYRASLTKRLQNGLNISAQYFLRKAEARRMVQRASVRMFANF